MQEYQSALASQIANTLASEYQKMMNEKNQEQMSRSVSFSRSSAAKADQELQEAVDRLNQFDSSPEGWRF